MCSLFLSFSRTPTPSYRTFEQNPADTTVQILVYMRHQTPLPGVDSQAMRVLDIPPTFVSG